MTYFFYSNFDRFHITNSENKKIKFHGFFDDKTVLNIDNRIVLKIDKPTFSFKNFFNKKITTYDITEQSYIFKCTKIFSNQYCCSSKNGRYDFYQHNGHKSSLFLNSHQIAYIDLIQDYKGDFYEKYIIVCNSDVDVLILIGLILLFYVNRATIDCPNNGIINLRKSVKFNNTWKPSNVSNLLFCKT